MILGGACRDVGDVGWGCKELSIAANNDDDDDSDDDEGGWKTTTTTTMRREKVMFYFQMRKHWRFFGSCRVLLSRSLNQPLSLNLLSITLCKKALSLHLQSVLVIIPFQIVYSPRALGSSM